jgi:oxygen-independent coproporphyrinogen III oxidase
MTPISARYKSVRPRSAYVHVPFCKHRCGYCNFTLVAGREDLVDAYLSCLEIELSRQLQSPQPVQTLFLGGGTPTHLASQQLQRLLELLKFWLPLQDHAEYSCEANPLDCLPEKLSLLRAFGVNRISLGGQSFNDSKLQRLERDHTGQELIHSVHRTSELFSNVSLDLIFAAPQETLADWQRELSQALALPISHLSTYGLTIERGANFWGRLLRGNIEELDDDLQLEMYVYTMDSLAQAGWQHYEVSNFSLPGYQCRHNQAYWQGSPWWAFGPGASSFLPLSTASNAIDDSTITNSPRWLRATNHRSTTQYIRLIQSSSTAIHERDELNLEQVIRERLVFGLRQLAGVDLAELSRQWGNPVDELFEPYLSQYLEHHWLTREQDRLRLTRQGLVISDSLWPNLLG